MNDTIRAFGACTLLVSLALAGCGGNAAGGGGDYGSGDPSLTAPNPLGGPVSPFIADGAAVQKALDAIEAKSGKPLRTLSLESNDGRGLTVQVQEPDHRVNVDEYVVAPNGSMSGPAPVKLDSMSGGPVTAAEVDAEAFDPRSFPWSRLAQTVRDGIAKSNFSDARASEWEIDGLHKDDKRTLYYDAQRGRPVALLNADLTIAQMRF